MIDNWSELATILANGFLIDTINLFQKNNYFINTNNLKILEHIKNYFELAKQGYNFYTNNIYPKDNTDNVLDTFKNIVYILVNYFDKPYLNEDDFLGELQVFENEVDLVIKEREVNQNKVKNSLKLFNEISKLLLTKFDNII